MGASLLPSLRDLLSQWEIIVLVCPWIFPVLLSDTLAHTVEYGVEIYLKSPWKFSPLHKLGPTISHPLLGPHFFKAYLGHLSKRGTEVLGKNEWDGGMIWKPEIYRNLQILDERNNALCLAFVPFPHCLTVIDSLEFGENVSNNRQSLHCILFPSLFRSYCDLGPRRLISGLYPSNSSFRWIPLHVGELSY